MYFNRTIHNISRIRQFAEILIKYGFEDIIENTALRRIFFRKGAKSSPTTELQVSNRWERVRLVIEELGPTFIKLGQLLSNRPDVLPEPLIKELEKLQDKVPPFDVKKAREIIEKENRKSLNELFSYFDEKPLGSASFGQVHRARLLEGEDVVVKIRRPGARQKVIVDLRLLKDFIKLAENFFLKNGILNPIEIVETFEKIMLEEIDFRNEAKHLEQFKKVYSEEKDLYLPKVYASYSSQRVIVVEFISGCKITEVDTISSWGIDPKALAVKGCNLYLNQIFEKGFFHADPHPGNVLVKPNGSIALIDYGMTEKITKSQRFAFAGIFVSIAKRDASSLAINLRRLSTDHDISDMKEFENELEDLIVDYTVLGVGDMQLQDFTARLQKIAYKFKLHIPGKIFLIFRALAILEGISTKLDPSFETLEHIRPFGFRLIAEQFSWDNIKSEIEHSAYQLMSLFYNLPLEIRDIIRQIRKGKVNLNLTVKELEVYTQRKEVWNNKLILAIFISTLIISTTLTFFIKQEDSSYAFLGISLLTWIFIVLTGFTTFLLIVYHLFNRK